LIVQTTGADDRSRYNTAVQTSRLQVVRKASFTATPWKNGGGITHEAIRVPAGADAFHWRVSVAHIDASGPFSDFAAYNRQMVLLQGAGLDLRFGSGGRETLRRPGDLVEFDGALTAHCELLQGPCVDLNLMVLKSLRAAARVERGVESLVVAAAPGETTLIFPIDRAIVLTLSGEETRMVLEPWDLAVLALPAHGAGHVRSLESPATVFLAALGAALGPGI
jgi:environmental stress-induced protein Ves